MKIFDELCSAKEAVENSYLKAFRIKAGQLEMEHIMNREWM